MDLEDKLEHDSKSFLKDGKPINPHNDYQRHLYARSMRIHGMTRDEVKLALLMSDMTDIELRKKLSYIEDILNSIIVGFLSNDEALPAYTKEGQKAG